MNENNYNDDDNIFQEVNINILYIGNYCNVFI